MRTLIFLTLLGVVGVIVIFFASIGLGIALVVGAIFFFVLFVAYFLDGLNKGWSVVCKILKN